MDIRDPTQCKELAIHDTADWALRVALTEDLACIADWHGGLRIVDVRDPRQPKEVGKQFLPWAWDVAAKDNLVYMADENKGLRAFDIADPTNPRETWDRDRPEPGDALNVVVAGEGLFSVDGWLGLTAYNIGKRPQSPSHTAVGLYLIESLWNHWEK